MFSFFTHITHALATFIVGALIATGLATVPVVATNTPSTQTGVSASSTIIASTTETTPVPVEIAPTSQPSQPKTNSAPAPAPTQSTAPSTPAVTTSVPTTNSVIQPITTTNTVVPTTPQPATITIKADTVGITSTGLQVFYDISSDSNSEVDIKTVEATITGVQAPTTMVTSITNDTQQQLLMASSQSASYNPSTGTINIIATLNKPLVIVSGYPTLFDITIPNVSPVEQEKAGNPAITITSVGAGYILKSGGAVWLPNPYSAAISYYLANHTCTGLQADEYSYCIGTYGADIELNQ